MDEAVALVLGAWGDLVTCRPIGMSIGPIPWTAMREWCHVEGLDHVASGVLVEALRHVDAYDLKQRSEKKSRTPPKGARR